MFYRVTRSFFVLFLLVSFIALLSMQVAVGGSRSAAPTPAEYDAKVRQLLAEEAQLLAKMPEDKREAHLANKQAEAHRQAIGIQKELGQGLNAARNCDSVVVGYVNDQPFMLADVLKHRSELDATSNGAIPFKVTTDMVLGKIIEEKAIYVEAARRSLLPSESEIDAVVEKFRELMAKATSPDYNTENVELVKSKWNAYLDGIGVSEDEFWSTIAPDIYGPQLIRYKLATDVRNGVPLKDGESEREHYSRSFKVWDEFLANLASESQVNIVRSDLL